MFFFNSSFGRFPTCLRILVEHEDLRGGLPGVVIPLLLRVVRDGPAQVVEGGHQQVHVVIQRNLILRLEGPGIHHRQGEVTDLSQCSRSQL